jgi:hypothetical protein
MQKIITFKRQDQCSLVVSYQLWREALRLAQNHDWEPEGTLAPQPYPYQAPWHGAYEWAYGQTVQTEDACRLGYYLQAGIESNPTLIIGEPRARLAGLVEFCRSGGFEIVSEVQ